MKYSLLQTAVFLVAFSTGSRAIRASTENANTAETTFAESEPTDAAAGYEAAYYPPAPAPPYAYPGSISATGANGGVNMYGNGANGGYISINSREDATDDVAGAYRRPVYVRPKPVYRRPRPRPRPRRRPYRRPVRKVINVSGANGGTNYGGNGANGGYINVHRRGGEVADHYRPYYWGHRHHRHHTFGVLRRDEERGDYYRRPKGRVNVKGANGGKNYGGNGANGGKIRVTGSRGRKSTKVRGANGGVNRGGNGANGGRIRVSRDEEMFGYYRPAKGSVNVKGANGGKNYGGNGANGGKIRVTGSKGRKSTKVSGANGGVNRGGNGANGGRISVS